MSLSLYELIGVLLAAVAVLGSINHRFIRLPDTVGITAAGLLVALALAVAGHFEPRLVGWARAVEADIDFPEVLFHGLLGLLLFAGSLHVDVADLAAQRLPLAVLSTVGVVLSTAIVGCGSWFLLRLLGLPLGIGPCLLFGALISPTDPIAVLGVLKTAGVPKALETQIAGESLFNDGTGVVVYLTLAGVVAGTTEPSFAAVGGLLVREVLGALVVGLALGYGAFVMLRGVDSYAVEILITLALATGGYSLAERLHVSALLAVVVMGLVIGNHGSRDAMSLRTRERLFTFWDLLDEVLNLVLFGLIGIKLLSLHAVADSGLVAAALLPLVLFARLASVGLPMAALRPWLAPTPHAVKVLSWGGLRGGISLALALSLPPSAAKEWFVTATYAVVLFSLLVQAPTMGALLRRLGIARAVPSPAPASDLQREVKST